MNKVILTGRPTKDPEVVKTQSGKSVARFTLAVDRVGSDKADFISCNAWERNAEFVEKYVEKGRKYIVEGSIVTGSYEGKDGKQVYTTDVNVSHVEFCEKKGNTSKPQEEAKDDFMAIPDDIEEELPFN